MHEYELKSRIEDDDVVRNLLKIRDLVNHIPEN
jgi:hypothetical protein